MTADKRTRRGVAALVLMMVMLILTAADAQARTQPDDFAATVEGPNTIKLTWDF